MIKNKKAVNITMETIIIAILGLIALIVVVIIFREFVSSSAKGYKDTSDKAIESAKGERCVALFSSDRQCKADPPGDGWTEIKPDNSKEWVDCKTPSKCWQKS